MTTNGETIGPEAAREMLATNEATAIDIRDDEAWKNGHLPGARHHTEDEIEEVLEQIDSDQKIIVVCEDGSDSADVAGRLSGEGERDFVSIEGGMAAWRDDDMPMQPSHDPDEDVPI